MTLSTFTEEVIRVVKSIPKGRVVTYGQVAAMAGNPRAARQVVRALYKCPEDEFLPWWRLVGSAGNGKGKVKIPDIGGMEQVERLTAEGVKVSDKLIIDLNEFGLKY